MIKLIIEKELRDIIGSTKFALTFGVCSILILLSFYVGGRNYQISRQQFDAGKRENLRKLEGITDWTEVRNFRIFLPPQPVTSLVMGVSNDIGRNTDVRGRGELNAEDSRYGEDPVYAIFRFLDLEFVFQIVLSLFAILFAYDAINGEKERGTLRLTFANSVPRKSFIVGKMAGSFLSLSLPFLVPILLGGLILILMGIPMEPADWIRLGFIVVAGFLYFGAFLGLSLLLSSLTERSSSSFLFLLVAWILSVMIIPRTAVLLAGRAVAVPTVDEIASQKSRYSASLWQEDRRKMADFRVDDKIPANEMLQSFQKFMSQLGEDREKKMNELAARLNEDRSNKQRVQEQIAFGLACLSPSAVFSLASDEISGTGIHLKNLYKEQAERYQKAYAEFMKGKTGVNPGGGFVFRINTDEQDQKKEPINSNEIPEFQFAVSPIAESFGLIAVYFGLLVLFNLVFFLGAFVSFLRFDVR
jgi:ABC-type transport system involved in multi-copper enzyme maturation permease subunit